MEFCPTCNTAAEPIPGCNSNGNKIFRCPQCKKSFESDIPIIEIGKKLLIPPGEENGQKFLLPVIPQEQEAETIIE